jgi:predicted transcriptional regulator
MKNMQNNLFIKESDLNFIQLNRNDVEFETENFKILKFLVSEHETMYSNIDKWFKLKVTPGIISGQRIAYIIFDDKIPIASYILKIGEYAKFCHLYIKEEYQNLNIGDLCFALMVLNAKRLAKEIHFTLPESLWANKSNFFKSWGFENIAKSITQYRNFNTELKCSEPFSKIWQQFKYKSPKIIKEFSRYSDDIFNGIIISIKPQYVEKIKSGEKVIEIRKKFNHKWKGHRATIYATSPIKSLFGYVTISKIELEKPDIIWSKYQKDIGCNKSEFNDYIQNNKEIFALTLDNFESYKGSIPLNHLNHFVNEGLKPPQSYNSLKKDGKWAEAVSVAELLHGRFKIYREVY